MRHFFREEEFNPPEPIRPSFPADMKRHQGVLEDGLDRSRRGSILDSVPGTPPTPVNDLNHQQSRVISGATTVRSKSAASLNGRDKDDEKASITIWKQIFDPVVPYVQVRPQCICLHIANKGFHFRHW